MREFLPVSFLIMLFNFIDRKFIQYLNKIDNSFFHQTKYRMETRLLPLIEQKKATKFHPKNIKKPVMQ